MGLYTAKVLSLLKLSFRFCSPDIAFIWCLCICKVRKKKRQVLRQRLVSVNFYYSYSCDRSKLNKKSSQRGEEKKKNAQLADCDLVRSQKKGFPLQVPYLEPSLLPSSIVNVRLDTKTCNFPAPTPSPASTSAFAFYSLLLALSSNGSAFARPFSMDTAEHGTKEDSISRCCDPTTTNDRQLVI